MQSGMCVVRVCLCMCLQARVHTCVLVRVCVCECVCLFEGVCVSLSGCAVVFVRGPPCNLLNVKPLINAASCPRGRVAFSGGGAVPGRSIAVNNLDWLIRWRRVEVALLVAAICISFFFSPPFRAISLI